MRLLYLTQWFDPEPGVIKGPDFVRALEDAGYTVTTVTGVPNYPAGRLYPGYRIRAVQHEAISGVNITRLPLFPSHDRSSLGRVLNFLSFFVSLSIYGLIRGRRHDIAYVYHPPITVGLAAAIFGRVHRLPFILEIQDLWPDTVAVSGMTGTGRLARILGFLCDFVYRRAAHIIVQSQGMCDTLIGRGVPADKLTVVRNWADAAATDVGQEVPEPKLPDAPFVFLYAGNLGRMQALETAIEATALAAKSDSRIQLHLVGDGVEAAALRKFAEGPLGEHVMFLPQRPVAALAPLFVQADALLLHLARDPLFEITIPSKTQFYLAKGMPVVAGIAGEAANILAASGAAIVVEPENVRALAVAMVSVAAMSPSERRAMGRSGRAYYDANLSFDTGMRKTLDVIAATSTGRRAG